jgi:hypothetical protein
MQVLAEQEWEDQYPSSRGEPASIASYMASTDQVPIMTAADSVLQMGNNGYAKPATALTVLRETVMGRELFDFAFKTYAQRWMFKRPEPADFFRTMEDASAVDLDWFWRGWFFGIEKCDLSLGKISLYTLDSRDPRIEKSLQKELRDQKPITQSKLRNAPLPKRIDSFPELADFYNSFDELDVTDADLDAYEKLIAGLKDEDKELLQSKLHLYVVEVENLGGLVSPVMIEATLEDGTREELRVPAEIWRKGDKKITKLMMTQQPAVAFLLDPHLETADTDLSNNAWPTKIDETRVRIDGESRFGRGGGRGGPNPMREARDLEKKKAEADEKPETEPAKKPGKPVEAGASSPAGG